MTFTDDDIAEVARMAGLNGGGPRPDPGGAELAAVYDRLRCGGSFILDAPPGVPAVWGRGESVLWAAGEALTIVGGPGVGKSTLGGQVTKARLVGGDVLGLPVAAGHRRVLYLACDRPRQIQRALARLFGPDDREMLDDRLRVWPGPPPADIAREPGLLLRLVKAADADTVVVDSLKDVAIGLSEDEVGGGYNRARQLALEAGCEVFEMHHQRKGGAGEKPKKINDVYGSAWITAGAGSVVLLWGEPGDLVVELIHLKQPAATIGPWKIAHDHDAGISHVHHGFDAAAYLRLRTNGVTAMETARAMFEKPVPTDNERKKAERALRALVERGLAERDESTAGQRGGAGGARYRAVAGVSALIGTRT